MNPLKTALYIRRSTNLQDNSIQMQRDQAFDKALKLGLIIDEEFLDDAVSARKLQIDDRPSLQALIQGIEQKRIDTVLVYKRDRLARKAFEHLLLYETFKKHNTNVIFTSEQELAMEYTPFGELVECLFGALAEQEGDLIVQRLNATTIAKFRNGTYTGSVPFGYRVNKEQDCIVLEEDKLAIVEKLYSMAANEHPINKLVDFATSAYPEKQWTPSSIYSLLSNPIYMGIRKLKLKDASTLEQQYSHLSIVDKDIWLAANDQIEQRTRRTRSKVKHEFPLTPLLSCNRCQSGMSGTLKTKHGERIGYYVCPNCRTVSHSQTEFEAFIHQCVYEHLNNLFRTDFEKLLKTYCERNFNKLMEQMKQTTEQSHRIHSQIISKTRKWVFDSGSVRDKNEMRTQMSGLWNKYRSLESHLERLQCDAERFKALPKDLLQFKQQMESKSLPDLILHQAAPETHIARIHVDVNTIDISFRHPFGRIEEVIPVE